MSALALSAQAKPSSEAKIDEILRSLGKSDGVGLGSATDKVLVELESMGWVQKQRLPPRVVGVDPSNRDGMGVNAETVHSLGADILAMGFSWSQVASAVCIEEAPQSKTIRDFNADLAVGSGRLPAPLPEDIKYGSLSCSHTNMFLRCLWAGVESSDEDMSENGHLSLDKVSRRDAEFGRAAREGLEWKILSHKVRSRFPKLLSLVQRARNAPNAATRAEHEVQVMLRMHQIASQEQQASANVDWDAIRRGIALSKPPCVDDLRQLSIFVAVCGGGTNGVFLKDLAAFHRQFVDSSARVIRGGFFGAVSEMDAEAPLFKIAVVKAQYVCPQAKVNKYKEPVFITPADLSKLKKASAPSLADAEALLGKIRSLFRAHLKDDVVGHSAKVKLLGRFDTLVARFMMGKQEGLKTR